MISKRTAEGVAKALDDWTARRGMSQRSVLELLEILAKIPGNKSFQDSIQALRRYFAEKVEKP